MQVIKSQTVRLWDVFILGPFMIYMGVRKSDLPPIARAAIATSGMLTIAYNGMNYLANKELEDKGKIVKLDPFTDLVHT